MSIILMTRNRRKIAEYRRFFQRHAQTLIVEEPTESAVLLKTWLGSALAVLADESNIYTPEGDLFDRTSSGPARNFCRLHAWVLDGDKVVRKSYLREVVGTFDGTALRPDDPDVFDWDSAFSPAAGVSLHDLAKLGLKNAARESCLSAFARDFLRRKEQKKLAWTDVDPKSIVDWDTDASMLLEHPLYADLPPALRNAFHWAIQKGIFFRSAASRRDGNYWLPGLNGGLPYVPKGDPVHEATYLFHDVMHQLMPDLIFDGSDSDDHRRTYIAYRMMSEAVSLVLADMLFVDHLANGACQDYDFTPRRIHPLFLAMPEHVRQPPAELLRRMMRYVLLGDASGFPVSHPAWAAFEEKYSRFFVGDFQWTRMNWSNLLGRADMSRRWIELIGPDTLESQGLWRVSDVVTLVGRERDDQHLAASLFDLVMEDRIEPALAFAGSADAATSTSNGFRRWLTGQCALFARYAPIVGIPALGRMLADRLRTPRGFSAKEMTAIRGCYRAHVASMAKLGLVSDDAAMYPDLFPLFDPFFLKDYDRSAQEFATVAEASAAALGSVRRTP